MLRWKSDTVSGAIFLLGLCFILIYGSWKQALFFRGDSVLVSTIIISLGIVGFIYAYGVKRLRVNKWLMALGGYALYSALTAFWSADHTLAITGMIVNFAVVALAAFVPALNDIWKKRVLVTLVASGAALYIFAFLTVFGWVHYNQALQGNLIDSVFQYHNTFGTFELAVSVISLVLAADAERRIASIAFSSASTISLAALILSYSRWAWLESAGILVAYVVVATLMKRSFRPFLTFLFVAITALAQVPFAIQSIHTKSPLYYLLSLLIAIVGSVVGEYLSDLVTRQPKGPRKYTVFAVITGLPVVAVLAALVTLSSKSSSLVTRLHSINTQDFSLQERLWYYGAAQHMWRDNPIFGSGGGSWASKYQAYQQFPYTSTMTHSSFFEQLTNFGLIGTILWVLVIALCLIEAVKTLRTTNSSKTSITLAAMLGALALLVHSLFDFDMDYALVTFVFFILLAIIGSRAEVRDKRYGTSVHTTVSIVAGVVIFMAITLSASESYLTRAMAATGQDRLTALNNSLTFAPYNVGAHYQLAHLELGQFEQIHSQPLLDKAWGNLQAAANASRWNPTVQQECAVDAYTMGHFNEAYDWAKRSMNDARFSFDYTATFQSVSLWSGVAGYHTDPAMSKQMFQSTVNAYTSAAQRLDDIKDLPSQVHAEWTPQITTPMQVYAAAAMYGLGDNQKSLDSLKPLLAVNNDQNTQTLYQIIVLLDEYRLKKITQKDVALQLPQNTAGTQQEVQALMSVGN